MFPASVGKLQNAFLMAQHDFVGTPRPPLPKKSDRTKPKGQQMTTDLRLQSLISDKDSSNICHLRPKNGSSNCDRALGVGSAGNRLFPPLPSPPAPTMLLPQNAAKLQLEVIPFFGLLLGFSCWQPKQILVVLFMKNEAKCWDNRRIGRTKGIVLEGGSWGNSTVSWANRLMGEGDGCPPPD